MYDRLLTFQAIIQIIALLAIVVLVLSNKEISKFVSPPWLITCVPHVLLRVSFHVIGNDRVLIDPSVIFAVARICL